MTAYAIKLAAGGWLAILDKGILRHVDRAADARPFDSMTSALVAADWLGLDPAAYRIEPVEGAS